MTLSANLLRGSEFVLGRTLPGEQGLADSPVDGLLAAWKQALSGASMEQALATANGPFALCAMLEDGRVLIAVDRFAIETLCYRIEGAQIRVAGRADELAEGTALDPQAVYDYLYFHTIPSPRTAFKGVLRLPPGHFGIFDGHRLEVRRYWRPRFSSDLQGTPLEQLKQEFRRRLEDAVRRSLGSTGKAGCYLSGGTDSSTVAGMIGRVTGTPAATYSIGFDAKGYDEMAFARVAARHFGTQHHEYYVTPEDLLHGIPQVAAAYDQPFGNSSAVPAFFCASMAERDGVRRILAGDGGDELFGGNKRYATQEVFGWYDDMPSPVRSLLRGALLGTSAGRLPLLRKGASYVRQASVPLPDRTQTYNQLERMGIHEVLEPSFLAQVDTQSPLMQQREVWADCEARSRIDRHLAFDWRYTLAETDLPKVCGTARLAGLEVGFPMLDAALTDFSLRLPADLKLRRLQLRWFFKEALRGFLPDEIIRKKKQGFGLPFGLWLCNHEGLKRLAGDSLSRLAGRNVVRPAFIRSLLEVRLQEHPGYYGEMVWVLMMLEQWLSHHRPDQRFAG